MGAIFPGHSEIWRASLVSWEGKTRKQLVVVVVLSVSLKCRKLHFVKGDNSKH
jgi:hypothetical protein